MKHMIRRYWALRHERQIKPVLREMLHTFTKDKPEFAGVRAIRSGHRGHDSTLCLKKRGVPVAMVRLTRPYVVRPGPAPGMPFTLAEPKERITRERDIYRIGCTHGITPEPIWCAENALVCRYVNAKPPPKTIDWQTLAHVNQALSKLHALGISHMDMSPGNVLLDSASQRVVFVDFEYKPAEGLSVANQRAYDYLRLLESSWKFMPSSIRGDYVPWLEQVMQLLDKQVTQVELSKLAPALTRILAAPGLGDALKALFSK